MLCSSIQPVKGSYVAYAQALSVVNTVLPQCMLCINQLKRASCWFYSVQPLQGIVMEYSHVLYLYLYFICSRNPYLVIQPPDIEQVVSLQYYYITTYTNCVHVPSIPYTTTKNKVQYNNQYTNFQLRK
jgi:hypothetical protein